MFRNRKHIISPHELRKGNFPVERGKYFMSRRVIWLLEIFYSVVFFFFVGCHFRKMILWENLV